MIKKITLLRDFGIFKDFSWSGDLPEFREKNIFYGWNYSGKTTLSRLLNSLKEKSLPDKYQNAQFKIVTDNGDITNATISSNDLSVQIFNAEYIKKNLKWDTEDSLDPIAFDVGEDVSNKRTQIEDNKNRIENIEGSKTKIGKIKPYQDKVNIFDEFENQKFRDEARRIKNDIFESVIEFDKRNIKQILSVVVRNIDGFIINNQEELQEVRHLSIARDDKQSIDDITFLSNFSSLKTQVENLLSKEPPVSEIIQKLQDDNHVYEWVKEGLEYHEESGDECAFCGNQITNERYQRLKNYFSNEDAELRQNITACKGLIEQEKSKIDNINLPRSKNDFTEKLQAQYEAKISEFSKLKNDNKSILDHLVSELERKENGNIFNPLKISSINEQPITDLTNWLVDVGKIITDHNDIKLSFSTSQTAARERLKKHHVAKFLKEEGYLQKQKDSAFSSRCINRYKNLIQKIKEKNIELEGELKNIVAGKNELNKYIKAFLNREDVVIDVTGDDKFILKRGTDLAYNLSEGEKTAIAFAYFLVSLESLEKEGKLRDQIIYIDDPISSLDSNHVAQIYSLINSFFFRKGLNPANPEQVVNCFKQLFISTHNFEFFSFLKDSGQINRRKKVTLDNGEKKEQPTCNYYLIKRIANDSSQISNLPKSFRNYKSEYVYLFELIYRFHESGCQESDEKFILMPNAIRRFLEMYTLMKLPHTRDEFENRVTELMGEGHSLKALNHFSHFTSFEKLTKHDEMIMNLPTACQELIDLLGKDNTHYESLLRSIGVRIQPQVTPSA